LFADISKKEIMKHTITKFIALSFSLGIISCSQEKILIRKASNAVDVYDYDKAISYYDQILAKDSNSFYANAGKGIVLSEYMGKYDKAIPYLEKASKNPKKASMKINNDLGRSYHYVGNYPRALDFYDKVAQVNNEDSEDYDYFLSKRISDCRYALEHPEVASVEEQSYKNIGPVINTDMPEYGAIYKNDELLFTSKRQDTPKEKKNGLDGRYFESMYVSTIKDGSYSAPRRYTLPDKGKESNFKRGSESALSISPDGKTLYVFRRGKIYEADLTDSTKGDRKMSRVVNISDFQSYATISPDGKMLLFASDSENGRGGTDLYKCIKDENGKWGKPELLNINTDNDEDAPFIAEDGTLFFASNGLVGYGGYDIYKSKYENGFWSTPINIGQPLNTPGDDIYFTLNPHSSNGYYASSRMGGYGDMDIYQIRYVSNEVPECKTIDAQFVINGVQKEGTELSYALSLTIPEAYKNNIKSISWKVNDETLSQTTETIEYAFPGANTYKVSAKVIAYCDTCPAFVAMCSEKEMVVGQPAFVSNTDSVNKTRTSTAINLASGDLTDEQLLAMGWNNASYYFDYDQSILCEDAKVVLNQNINMLKKNKDLVVVINGYADSRGTNDYNKNLSLKRANTVKQYMVKSGISRNRITAVNGYGENMITNGCDDNTPCTDEQHQINRKVDFKVSNNNKFITSVSIQ
jgi:outer membrane protein OmpA-like peptidoglycan-associated protein/tetratricopeptide (TPR) repeat protein